MKLAFHERRESGFPDGIWFANLANLDSTLKEYKIRAKDMDPNPERYLSSMGEAKKIEDTVTEISYSESSYFNDAFATIPHKVPAVFFTSPNYSQGVGTERIFLYWLDGINRWIGIAKYNEMVSSHDSSECHSGPYKVEGFLAKKLLEAYGLDKKSVEERDIWDVSKISPSELEKLAVK